MKNYPSFYATDETFSKEFNFLRSFNPYALEDKCKRFEDHFPDGFLETIRGGTNELNPVINYHSELRSRRVDSSMLLDVKNYKFSHLFAELKSIGSAGWDESITRNLISQYGMDSFGIYLPFHNYHNCNWGIYLFPEIIYHYAELLHAHFRNSDYDFDKMLIMYFFAVYRQQLFHYQTERYTTKLELITHQPHFRRLSQINEQVKNSEDWLEVAISCATVLDSRLVSNRSDMGIQKIRDVFIYVLKSMPAGYCDYSCVKYKGLHKAHLHFASQIKEMLVIPGFILPDLFTIKGEFGSNDLSVPLYFVTGFRGIDRIR